MDKKQLINVILKSSKTKISFGRLKSINKDLQATQIARNIAKKYDLKLVIDINNKCVFFYKKRSKG